MKIFENLLKKNVADSPFAEEMREVTSNMYRLGWDERNGGNVSRLLTQEEATEYFFGKGRIQLPLPVNVLVKRGRFLFAFILALSLIERRFIMEFIKKVSESRLFTLKSFDRLIYNLTYRVLRIYNFNKYKHKIILRSIKRGSRNFTALFV